MHFMGSGKEQILLIFNCSWIILDEMRVLGDVLLVILGCLVVAKCNV